MDASRVDLSVLDPSAEAGGWERLTGAIGRRAEPILARHRLAGSPLFVLTRWRRPVLAAAAAICAACAIAWALSDGRTTPYGDAGVAADPGIAGLTTQWITDVRPLTREDLIAILEAEGP